MNEQPDFVTVAHFHKRTSRTSGKTLYFGRANGVRLYLFVNELRQAKDCAPDFSLCLRAEDYEQIKDKLPAVLPARE